MENCFKKLLNFKHGFIFCIVLLLISCAYFILFTKEDAKQIDFDNQADYFLPWKEDAECQYAIRFAKNGTLPIRGLVSFQGSGNTLFRTIFEALSGVFTGYVGRDGDLYDAGFLGEDRYYKDGSTLLQKFHYTMGLAGSEWNIGILERFNIIREYNGNAVLLIRNPFDAIISDWNLESTNIDHTGYANVTTYGSPEFQVFINTAIVRWAQMIHDWVEYGDEIQIVFYEDLIENPVAEVERVLNDLKVPIERERRDCLIKHYKDMTEKFHRKKSKIVYPYSEDNIYAIRTFILETSRFLEAATGRGLPLDKYRCYKNCDQYKLIMNVFVVGKDDQAG